MEYQVKKYYKNRRAVALITVSAASQSELETKINELSKDGNKYVIVNGT